MEQDVSFHIEVDYCAMIQAIWLQRAIADVTDGFDLPTRDQNYFQLDQAGFQYYADRGEIGVYHEDDSTFIINHANCMLRPFQIAQLLQAYLKRFKITTPLSFSVAHTSGTQMADSPNVYGGSAYLITRRKIDTINTVRWHQDMNKKAMARLLKGR